jgi:hypothetical protein
MSLDELSPVEKIKYEVLILEPEPGYKKKLTFESLTNFL